MGGGGGGEEAKGYAHAHFDTAVMAAISFGNAGAIPAVQNAAVQTMLL